MKPQLRDIVTRMVEVVSVKNQAGLASFLGISPSKITDAIRRGTIPDSWLYRVAYKTRCRVEWLKLGQQPIFLDEAIAEARMLYGVPSLEEIGPLIDAWKELGEDDRRIVENCIKMLKFGEGDLVRDVLHALERKLLHDRSIRDVPRDADPAVHPDMRLAKPGQRATRSIPVLSLVAAGQWRPMQDPYPVGRGYKEVKTDLPGRYLYGLTIEGDSMEPAYRDGETIFVDPEKRSDDQRALVIVKQADDEAVCFKQLIIAEDGERWLHSLNPNYADIEMRKGDEFRGRVVAPKRPGKRR